MKHNAKPQPNISHAAATAKVLALADGPALSTKIGFGAGQIAGQIFRDTPSLLLLFYLTSVVGIAPAVAGIAIFIPKTLGGVVADLAVGLVSDRVSHSFPRRNWLLIGALLAPLSMVALFHAPAASPSLQLMYIVVVMLFYMLSFATFSVPYLAQFSEITRHPRQRTVLLAWRHAFTGVGLLIGSALTPAMIQRLGGAHGGYAAWSWGLGAICAASLLSAFLAAPRLTAATQASQLRLRALFAVLRYRPYRILLSTAFCQTCGAGMSYAGLAYFLRYDMHRTDTLLQIGFIVLVMASVVMVCSPLWVYVSRRLTPKRTFVLAASLHAAVELAWGCSAAAPMPVIYVYAALVGLFNTGWGLMSLTMLSDIIAKARAETGRDQAGAFAALWTLSEKIGIALGGTLIAGLLLSATGFTVAQGHGAPMHRAAHVGIAMVFALVPAFINTGAAIYFGRFGRPAAAGADEGIQEVAI
jgi:Na+/melibiose symporter-like transporter